MQKVSLSLNLVNAFLSYVANSYSKSMTFSEVSQLVEAIKSEAEESMKSATPTQPEKKEPEVVDESK